MARLLIVGCGCRGRALGAAAVERGWRVRGTTRRPESLAEIESAGIEAVIADPDRAATVLEQVGDVAVLAYLMGSADGDSAAAVNGPRLERILEELVDTPLRRFVFEASGTASQKLLVQGRRLVGEAGARWQIPTALIEADPADHGAWLSAAVAASIEW